MDVEESDAFKLAALTVPATRECGRPKLRTAEPCMKRIKAHHAACHGHMTLEERAAAVRDDAERAEQARRLRDVLARGPLITYLRWLKGLPDLSGTPDGRVWRAFATAHDERCALCRCFGCEVVDHDHTTGLVRGLLCVSCNSRAISGIVHTNFRKLPSLSPASVLYCQNPPALVMGMRRKYTHPFGWESASAVRDILWRAGSDGVEPVALRV